MAVASVAALAKICGNGICGTDAEIAEFRDTGVLPERFLKIHYREMCSAPCFVKDFDKEWVALRIFDSVFGPYFTTELSVVAFRRWVFLGPDSIEEVFDSIPSVCVRKMLYPLADEMAPPLGQRQDKVNWQSVEIFQKRLNDYLFELECEKYMAVWGEPRPKLVKLWEKEARKTKRARYEDSSTE